MKRYKFRVKISKKSDRLPGKEYSPKGFYYQGKKDIVLVGDETTGDTTRLKLPVEDVEIEVL